jgi:uncharacterized membrane protein
VARFTALALTGGALFWSAILLLTPFWLSAPRSARASVAAFVYESAGLICHQRAERSFHLAGVQLPVCARCSGLYFSAALGTLVAWTGRRRMPARTRMLLAVSAMPTALTVAAEVAGLAHPSNGARAIAAVPLGAAAGWAFVSLLRADATDAFKAAR